MEQFCGGKGFNQAIALRRAGNEVSFAGSVGQDGGIQLDKNGMRCRFAITLESTEKTEPDSGQNQVRIIFFAQSAGTMTTLSRAAWPSTPGVDRRAGCVLSAFSYGQCFFWNSSVSR